MSEKLFYTVIKTTSGWVGILGSSTGLRRTTLPQPTEKRALASLEINGASAVASEEHFKNLVHRFQAYYSGQKATFPDKLDLGEATPFQRQVWEACREIPYGETKSYAWIARQTGKPGAARAAGQALGKNPLPIVVPCHRVLSSDGGLGGFTGGLATKKRLLALEKQSGK
jgi:methylated-DNA-[protein]-cysteine S-methyltransferase